MATKVATVAKALVHLDVLGVSEAVGTSIETVRRWIRQGRLAATRTGAGGRGRYRVSIADLELFLSARSRGRADPGRVQKPQRSREWWDDYRRAHQDDDD